MMHHIKPLLPNAWIKYHEEAQRRKLAVNKFLNTPPGDYYSLDPFDYYKCIFVHIPKAAGVSINKALFGNLAGGHQSIQDYQSIFREKTFKNYFKFTIVRHPESRIISAFDFLKAGGFDERDKLWSEQHLSAFDDINDFIKHWLNKNSMHSKNHFTPQISYLRDRKGQINIDFIGRLESIDQDFDKICKEIRVKRRLSHSNKSTYYRKSRLTEDSKKRIQNLYLDDYNAFSY